MPFSKGEGQIKFVVVKTINGFWNYNNGINPLFTDEVIDGTRLFDTEKSAKDFYKRIYIREKNWKNPLPKEFETVKIRREITMGVSGFEYQYKLPK